MHLPSENKQELTVEPYHSRILWQIHQLAADVICIQDYCNLSMSGKQPNLVSDGRSDFQFAFQEGPGLWQNLGWKPTEKTERVSHMNDHLIPQASCILFFISDRSLCMNSEKNKFSYRVLMCSGVIVQIGVSVERRDGGEECGVPSLQTVPCCAFASVVGPCQIVFTFLKDVSPLEAWE